MIGRLNGWIVANEDSLRRYRETVSPSVNRKGVKGERILRTAFREHTRQSMPHSTG